MSVDVLFQVMRQSDVMFSNILTKIGNGDQLTDEETARIEDRFYSRSWCEENAPNAVRLFHRNFDVDSHSNKISAQWYSISKDEYLGTLDPEKLASAHSKVHKMSGTECVNMVYSLPLALNQPYMITSNLKVEDGLVNGAIGYLRKVDFERGA